MEEQRESVRSSAQEPGGVCDMWTEKKTKGECGAIVEGGDGQPQPQL